MAHIGDNTVSVIEEAADPAPGSDASIVLIADETLPPGVSQIDFDAALAAGREKGHLTQDELIDALHSVELTPEVLAALVISVSVPARTRQESRGQRPGDEGGHSGRRIPSHLGRRRPDHRLLEPIGVTEPG